MKQAKAAAKITPHLKGIQAFVSIFGVSRETVRQWARDGAPIFLVGRRYQACYSRLCLWLEQRHQARKDDRRNAVNRSDAGATPE